MTVYQVNRTWKHKAQFSGMDINAMNFKSLLKCISDIGRPICKGKLLFNGFYRVSYSPLRMTWSSSTN